MRLSTLLPRIRVMEYHIRPLALWIQRRTKETTLNIDWYGDIHYLQVKRKLYGWKKMFER